MEESQEKIIHLETKIKLLNYKYEQLKKIINELPTAEDTDRESHKYLGRKDHAFICGYLEESIRTAKKHASFFDDLN